jgi:YidC/Oxa1 family membrane protein insertase
LDIGAIWDLIILQPVINSLIWLSDVLFSNFGLTIIVFTVFVRVLMYPLTKKQLRATKGMQELQPKLKELQKKYGKDKQAMAKEQMKLYKESGLNPAGCMLPMLVQLPVWIALYQSIIRVLAVSPEDFLSLSRYLYSWPIVFSTIPLANDFLWLDLAVPDAFIAVLVGGTMWIQQKMAMPVTSDPRQQAQSQMMLWMMPLLFAFFCLSFPSGLSLYWLASNIISVVMQYFVTGWGALAPGRTRAPGDRDKGLKRRISVEEVHKDEAPMEADIVVTDTAELEDGNQGRGGYTAGFRPVKRQSRKSKGHRSRR